MKTVIVVLATLLLGTGSSAQELQLAAILDEALKNNPDIRASQARIEAAKYRIPQVKSLPDPMVSVGYQNVGLSRYSYGDYPESQWMFTGAVKRIRPKIMTVSVILAGLIPIMFSHGTGADVMKRIAAPMVGGVITSTILELIIYPAIYMIWRGRGFAKD